MSASYRSNLVDVRVKLHRTLKGSILVSKSGSRKAAVWLPLDVVEVYTEPGWGDHEITLPRPLASRKGLL